MLQESTRNEGPGPAIVDDDSDHATSKGAELDDFRAMACGRDGMSLAQKLHDEFLVCKICLEDFRNPRCLDCMHTFCEQCIETHVLSETSYKKYSDYRKYMSLYTQRVNSAVSLFQCQSFTKSGWSSRSFGEEYRGRDTLALI